MRTLWNSGVVPASIFQSTGWLAAIISFCLALFVLVPSLGAQTLAGINRTVTDASGAVVPDAVVTAVNNDTGVSNNLTPVQQEPTSLRISFQGLTQLRLKRAASNPL